MASRVAAASGIRGVWSLRSGAKFAFGEGIVWAADRRLAPGAHRLRGRIATSRPPEPVFHRREGPGSRRLVQFLALSNVARVG